MSPRLAGSARVNGHRDYVIKAMLHGLSGPLDGTTYGDLMIPMANNPDDWVASVASYVRTSFGNTGGLVTPADVKRVRAATAARKTPWSIPELETSVPKVLIPDPATWKATASHNSGAAGKAFSMAAWTSGVPQERGMWFQIELPHAATINEIQFSSNSPGGRGGGGVANPVPSAQAPCAAPPGRGPGAGARG